MRKNVQGFDEQGPDLSAGKRTKCTMCSPSPRGEGGPRPALSPAGAGRVRGQFSVRVPTPRVRDLRRQETAAEKLAWRLLRDRCAGLKFRRQFPIGNYVVDFYCFEVCMAVELDGSAHAQPSQAKKDRAKDAYLTRLGIRVLRLPNGQVMEDPEGFVKKIHESALSRIPPERPLTRPAPAG